MNQPDNSWERQERQASPDWDYDADYLEYGPQNEALIRRTIRMRELLESHLQTIAQRYYRLLANPAVSDIQTLIPFHDARLEFDGGYIKRPVETVRFSWTYYVYQNSYDEDVEFPLSWAWDTDWESKAKAAAERAVAEAKLAAEAKERQRLIARIKQAEQGLEWAKANAAKQGIDA